MSISIQSYSKNAVEVNLWSFLFERKQITAKSEGPINEALAKIDRDFESKDFTKHEVIISRIAARMDVQLKPAAGGKKKPSVLFREKWKSGELTLPQLNNWWAATQEAIGTGSSEAISIATFAKDAVEIDLWGSDFEVVAITGPTEPELDAKLEQALKPFEGKPISDGVQVELFAARMDVWLKPIGTNRKKASTVILDKWQAGELTLATIDSFWEGVQEEVNRP